MNHINDGKKGYYLYDKKIILNNNNKIKNNINLEIENSKKIINDKDKNKNLVRNTLNTLLYYYILYLKNTIYNL